MSDDVRDPDVRERQQAAALAEALEGRPAGDDVAEDAEVAALLRYAAGDAELGDERAEAILQELVQGGLPEAAPAPRRRGWWSTWLAGLGAAAAAAAAILLLARAPVQDVAAPAADAPRAASAPAPPGAAQQGKRQAKKMRPLPPPPASLLSAQAAASRRAADRAALDAEMARYRQRVLRELDNRYPAKLGLLCPGEGER